MAEINQLNKFLKQKQKEIIVITERKNVYK